MDEKNKNNNSEEFQNLEDNIYVKFLYSLGFLIFSFFVIGIPLVINKDTNEDIIIKNGKIIDKSTIISGVNALKKLIATNGCIEYDLRDVDLSSKNLKEVTLKNSDLRGANLTGVLLNEGTVINANFNNANLSYSDLRSVLNLDRNFKDCTFFRANL